MSQLSTSIHVDTVKRDRHNVNILFCSECNNMLYPKEQKRTKTLKYACRNCDYQQDAESPCVYVNNLEQEVE